MRRIDLVAGGVASSFGAGLFVGLAPAADLAGGWLPAAVLLGLLVGGVAELSTSERPVQTVPDRLRRLVFMLGTLGRLAAAVALAGAVAVYLTPFAALGVVVVGTALAVAGVPVVVVRVAAVVVAGVLLIVVVSCFAIAPVAPAVAVPDGGSGLGVLAAAGLMAVCAFAARNEDALGGPRWGRVTVLVIVSALTLAVAVAALHQLGAARLAISPAPLRAALAAADASALDPLLLAAVVVGCGFALYGVLRGLPVPGVPRIRSIAVGGAVTAFGALVIPPSPALAATAALLLADAAVRTIAVRHRRIG